MLVRGFQLAWPPLAYSVADDDEARRTYALIVTWFTARLHLHRRRHVAAGALDRPPPRRAGVLRVLRGDRPALPPASPLYALYLALVVILGRTGRTEFNFPATAVATVANIVLNLVLSRRWGSSAPGSP